MQGPLESKIAIRNPGLFKKFVRVLKKVGVFSVYLVFEADGFMLISRGLIKESKNFVLRLEQKYSKSDKIAFLKFPSLAYMTREALEHQFLMYNNRQYFRPHFLVREDDVKDSVVNRIGVESEICERPTKKTRALPPPPVVRTRNCINTGICNPEDFSEYAACVKTLADLKVSFSVTLNSGLAKTLFFGASKSRVRLTKESATSTILCVYSLETASEYEIRISEDSKSSVDPDCVLPVSVEFDYTLIESFVLVNFESKLTFKYVAPSGVYVSTGENGAAVLYVEI